MDINVKQDLSVLTSIPETTLTSLNEKVIMVIGNAVEEALLKEDDSEIEVEDIPMALEERAFDEVKEEVTELVMNKFYPNDLMDEVNKIVEKSAAIGVKVNDMVESQVDLLEEILIKLQDRADELGL